VLAVAASLSPAAAAWACVPQPTITSIEPRASGPAGAQVTVVGNNFDPAPVEIRWTVDYVAPGQRLAVTAWFE